MIITIILMIYLFPKDNFYGLVFSHRLLGYVISNDATVIVIDMGLLW